MSTFVKTEGQKVTLTLQPDKVARYYQRCLGGNYIFEDTYTIKSIDGDQDLHTMLKDQIIKLDYEYPSFMISSARDDQATNLLRLRYRKDLQHQGPVDYDANIVEGLDGDDGKWAIIWVDEKKLSRWTVGETHEAGTL